MFIFGVDKSTSIQIVIKGANSLVFFVSVPGAQMRFRSIRPTVPKYDFYLSYAPEEKNDVERVKELFLEKKKDLKFFTADSLKESTDLAQEQMFNVMKTCTRYNYLLV